MSELFHCGNCGRTGQLRTDGRCGNCGSDAVIAEALLPNDAKRFMTSAEWAASAEGQSKMASTLPIEESDDEAV